jgi:hypothetical protein
MARIVTTDAQPGDALSAATENAKFTAVATATADLDQQNVRDEGVDGLNLCNYPAHVHMNAQDNASTTPTAYNSGWTIGGGMYGADARQDISHGSGLVLNLGSGVTVQAGDLVIVEWQVLKWDLVAGGTGNDNDCWVVQAYWDLTSNALANYVTLEGDDNHGGNFQIPGREFPKTQDCSVIPNAVIIGATTYDSQKHTTRGLWLYEHSGADITVYGIKLMVSGNYGITFYDSGVGFADEVFYPNPTAAQIRLERGLLTLTVVRK